MCGIAGFWGRPGSNEELCALAGAMGDRVRHRGPDSAGTFADGACGIALAHQRLAIIDITPAGHQPMASRSGRWIVVFNGEIYNFRSVRDELDRGTARSTWRGESDTEVLVEALDRWGVEDTLRRCDGMFAFAAWDRERSRLILARDRIGEKPLYYGTLGDGTFAFGSELRALQRHPAWRGEIDPDAVALLLRYNCIPAPASVWRNVSKLRPGHWLEVRDGAAGQPRSYWSVAEAMRAGAESRLDSANDSPERWVDALDEVLGEVVGQAMISDVPLGAFLSGGIDSSLIVSLMQQRAGRAVKTFTIGFRNEAFDEAPHARAVAAALGTEHHEVYLDGADALAVVPELAGIYDEPFADPSQVPTVLLARIAREHVTVALSGDAGDELFAGYSRYLAGRALHDRAARLPSGLRRAVATGLAAVPVAAWDRTARLLGPAWPRLLRNSPGDKIGRIARLLETHGREQFYEEFISHWPDPSVALPGASGAANGSVAAEAGAAALTDIEFMQAHDTLAYLPSDILCKVDRAAMAVSLETRTPFVDRRLVEFAWRVPQELKVRDGTGKWLLRQLLARYVPQRIIDRPKQGFGIPLGEWLRGPLQQWAEALLSDDALAASGLFAPAPIRRLWLEHRSGRAEWHHYLWNVLMFQAWHERNAQHHVHR